MNLATEDTLDDIKTDLATINRSCYNKIRRCYYENRSRCYISYIGELIMGFLNRLPARQDGYYSRNRMWKNKGSDTAANRRTLVSPSHMLVNIGGAGAHAYERAAAIELDLNESWVWDTQTPTDYTVAANRAGKDFYIYAVPGSGFNVVLVLSAATTYPAGYTADNSRKIGGFHCECADVGTISGHALSGYLAGDILPRSIQDLLHRPYGRFLPGFAWGGPTDFDSLNYAPLWTSIYHLSGTGASIASVFGAAATVSRNFYDFADDLKNIGARMMTDWEFAQLHSGTPEETNIFGSLGQSDDCRRSCRHKFQANHIKHRSGGHVRSLVDMAPGSAELHSWRGLFRSHCVQLREYQRNQRVPLRSRNIPGTGSGYCGRPLGLCDVLRFAGACCG